MSDLPEKQPKLEDTTQAQPTLGSALGSGGPSLWDAPAMATPRAAMDLGAMTPRQWGNEGGAVGGVPTPSMTFANFGATPMGGGGGMFDMGNSGGFGAAMQTPLAGGAMATPAMGGGMGMQTPNVGFGTNIASATPVQSVFAEAAVASAAPIQKITEKAEQLEDEWDRRNAFITDEELDELLPSAGFTIVVEPATYERKINHEKPPFFDIATRLVEQEMAAAAEEGAGGAAKKYDIPDTLGEGMPQMKPPDAPVFEDLLKYANIPDEALPSYDQKRVMILRALFKLKNGDSNQRRQGLNVLTSTERARRYFGAQLLFDQTLYVWRSRILDGEQQHRFIKLIKTLMVVFGGDALEPFVKDIIQSVEALLSDSNKYMREDGKDVISNVTRLAGITAVLRAVSGDIEAVDKFVRNSTAKVIAAAARAEGIEEVMKFALRLASDERLSNNARHTSVKIIHEVAQLFGSAILRHLYDLTYIASALLNNPNTEVRVETAHAITAMANACEPYGWECFDDAKLVLSLRQQCQRSHGRNLAAFLKAIGAAIPLMPVQVASRQATDLMGSLINQFKEYQDADLRKTVLEVIAKCVASPGVKPRYVQDTLLKPFLEGFWGDKRAVSEKRFLAALSACTEEIAKKIGAAEIVPAIVIQLREQDREEAFHMMVSDCVKNIIKSCGTLDFTDQQMAEVLEACRYAYEVDEDGFNNSAVNCLAETFNAFGTRVVSLAPHICGVILDRFANKLDRVRTQAAELTAQVAQTLIDCNNYETMTNIWSTFYASLNAEKTPGPIAAVLNALKALIIALSTSTKSNLKLNNLDNPAPAEVLQTVASLVGANRDKHVRLACIQLIGELVKRSRDPTNPNMEVMKLDAKALQDLATDQLFPLLAEEHRLTRKATADAYGDIARVVMPYKVVAELVKNLNESQRKKRICTGIALAVIAKKCKPWAVVPFLINEFQMCQNTQAAVVTQHAILKTIRFMFEYLGSDGKDYVYGFIPLLERAMTERDMQQRRQAIEASKAMVMALVNTDGNFEDVVIHLLNFTQPNIVEMLSRDTSKEIEERNKLVTAVVQYFEAAALVIGAPVVFRYLVEGLYHPASKVRDIYWRAYNMLYIQNPEAMIQCHPRLKKWDPSDDIAVLERELAGPENARALEVEKLKLKQLQPLGVVPELLTMI